MTTTAIGSNTTDLPRLDTAFRVVERLEAEHPETDMERLADDAFMACLMRGWERQRAAIVNKVGATGFTALVRVYMEISRLEHLECTLGSQLIEKLTRPAWDSAQGEGLRGEIAARRAVVARLKGLVGKRAARRRGSARVV